MKVYKSNLPGLIHCLIIFIHALVSQIGIPYRPQSNLKISLFQFCSCVYIYVDNNLDIMIFIHLLVTMTFLSIRPIRFRWYQGATSTAHPTYQQWALDDIRIGPPCSLMCSGHGSCDYPTCICDPGFHGDSCERSSGLPVMTLYQPTCISFMSYLTL